MHRRGLLRALAVGVIAAPMGAHAQRARIARFGVLSPGSPEPSPLLIVKEMEVASTKLALRIHRLGVSDPAELPDVFKTAADERVGAVFVIEEATLPSQRADHVIE